MIETILYALKPVAPLMILVAAFLDTFVGTGYLLYGFAMLATVGMLHLEGIVTLPQITVAASIGTVLASTTNFALGHWFGHTPWVQRRIDTAPVRQLHTMLDRYGAWWFIIIGRSVTFLRPSYALVLGLLKRPWQNFLMIEIPFALVWVVFWLGIIVLGERLII